MSGLQNAGGPSRVTWLQTELSMLSTTFDSLSTFAGCILKLLLQPEPLSLLSRPFNSVNSALDLCQKL